MKSANFQWFYSKGRKPRRERQNATSVIVSEINKEFNVTEELAASMSMEGITTSADLYEVQQMLRSLNIPIQILVGLLMDGTSNWLGDTVACFA